MIKAIKFSVKKMLFIMIVLCWKSAIFLNYIDNISLQILCPLIEPAGTLFPPWLLTTTITTTERRKSQDGECAASCQIENLSLIARILFWYPALIIKNVETREASTFWLSNRNVVILTTSLVNSVALLDDLQPRLYQKFAIILIDLILAHSGYKMI